MEHFLSVASALTLWLFSLFNCHSIPLRYIFHFVRRLPMNAQNICDSPRFEQDNGRAAASRKPCVRFVFFVIRATFYVTRITCIVFVFHLLSSFHGNRLSRLQTHIEPNQTFGRFTYIHKHIVHSRSLLSIAVYAPVIFARFFFEIVSFCFEKRKKSTMIDFIFFSALSTPYYGNYILCLFSLWLNVVVCMRRVLCFFLYSHFGCSFFRCCRRCRQCFARSSSM